MVENLSAQEKAFLLSKYEELLDQGFRTFVIGVRPIDTRIQFATFGDMNDTLLYEHVVPEIVDRSLDRTLLSNDRPNFSKEEGNA